MKKILILVLILTACTKKNDSTPKPQVTTTNQSSGYIVYYVKSNATTCKYITDTPTYANSLINATYYNHTDTPRIGFNLTINKIDISRIETPYTWYDSDIYHNEGIGITVIDKLEQYDLTNSQSGDSYANGTNIKLIKSFTITSFSPLTGYFKGATMMKYVHQGGMTQQLYTYTIDSGYFYIPYIRKK